MPQNAHSLSLADLWSLSGQPLSAEDRAELEARIETEEAASAERCRRLARRAGLPRSKKQVRP